MAGLSTRNHRRAVESVVEGYGIAKSSVSRQFVEASSNQLRVLCERRLEDLNLVVLMIDGIHFRAKDLKQRAASSTLPSRSHAWWPVTSIDPIRRIGAFWKRRSNLQPFDLSKRLLNRFLRWRCKRNTTAGKNSHFLIDRPYDRADFRQLKAEPDGTGQTECAR